MLKLMGTGVVRYIRLIRHVVAKPSGGFPFQETFWWTAAEQKSVNLFLAIHKEKVGTANPFFLP